MSTALEISDTSFPITRKEGEVAQHAVEKAKAAILDISPSAEVISKEGRGNFVTAGDKASEQAIFRIIHDAFPHDPILSEETEWELGDIATLPRLWIVDPIDGTNNYRYGRKFSAISVAYVELGIAVAGAVLDPFHNELFYAERNRGAWLNGEPLHVSDHHSLLNASVATDNSYDADVTRHHLELVLRLSPTPWVMMYGSAVLTMCHVAAGRTDAYFNTVLKPWDTAAASLIVTEAGGTVCDISGASISLSGEKAIVGNRSLVQQIVAAFATHSKD